MQMTKEKYRKLLAALGIIATTMIWGSSFVVMKNSVDLVPPAWLLAIRFTAAALVGGIVFHKNLLRMNRDTVFCGMLLGLAINVSYLFQTYGIKYTTASKNAFITTLYVIIVPFLHWMATKKRPSFHHLLAAVIAVAGLALLSLEGDLSIQYGDFLTLLCGIGFAVHMVLIDRFTLKHDTVALTILQLASAAVINWILAPFLDGPMDVSVLRDMGLWAGIFYLAVFCSMIGFLLQNLGQKILNANTASVLLSLESVFGAIFSVWLLHEVMTTRMLAGCALMFGAVILSQAGPEKS